MKVAVLLADKGTTNPQAGTLNLLNLGWAVTQLQRGPAGLITPAHAVAVFYEVEFNRCNRSLPLIVELLNEDGQPVAIPGGPPSMRIEQQIVVFPPPGAPNGTPGRGNLMLEIVPGLPLSPGRYAWNVTLDGDHNEDWSGSFYVFPPVHPPQVVFGGGPVSPEEG